MSTHMPIHAYTLVQTHTRTHAYAHAYTHAYTYTCTHVYILVVYIFFLAELHYRPDYPTVQHDEKKP